MTEEDLRRLDDLVRHGGPEDIGGWEEAARLLAEVRRLQALADRLNEAAYPLGDDDLWRQHMRIHDEIHEGFV